MPILPTGGRVQLGLNVGGFHGNDMADVVKNKVRSGEYATESEVIRDGLRALLARDRAVESWLHHQVGPAYDALKADPSRAVTVDQLRARLAVVAGC